MTTTPTAREKVEAAKDAMPPMPPPPPTPEEFDTYFIVGMKNGAPVVYLDMQVPGLAREREASQSELRRIVELVSSELHLRAMAYSVVAVLQEVAPESSDAEVKRRVEEAMAARMKEPHTEE